MNRIVQAPGGRIHISHHPGQDPALVLLHGFPDDSRIYDRLVPQLARRRVIALDWLGYGRSDHVQPGSLDDAPHQHQLRAVLDRLQLDRVVLVGHDAGGPDAIDYTLREPGRVDRLILLDTYYGHASMLRLPEAIRLLAEPELRPLAAVRAWTAALFPSLDRQDAHIAAGHLAALEVPVTLVFGAADNYLNPDLARQLAGLFRHADLHLVRGASHWPQWDQPELVARLIIQAAASDPGALLP